MPNRIIHRTVVTEDGGSDFVDGVWQAEIAAPGVLQTGWMPATSISFRRSPGDMDFDFHRAPRRRLVINTAGRLMVTATTGAARALEPGEILHVTDIAGRGHRSTCLSPDGLVSIFLALDDEHPNDHNAPLSASEPGPELLRQSAGGSARSRLDYRYGGPAGVVTEEFKVIRYRAHWLVEGAEHRVRADGPLLLCPIAGAISVASEALPAGAILALDPGLAVTATATTPGACMLEIERAGDADLA